MWIDYGYDFITKSRIRRCKNCKKFKFIEIAEEIRQGIKRINCPYCEPYHKKDGTLKPNFVEDHHYVDKEDLHAYLDNI